MTYDPEAHRRAIQAERRVDDWTGICEWCGERVRAGQGVAVITPRSAQRDAGVHLVEIIHSECAHEGAFSAGWERAETDEVLTHIGNAWPTSGI